MFTGIIEEIGTVKAINTHGSSGEILIKAATVTEDTKVGDSIAVNGVCLTVTKLSGNGFAADIMPETLRRSNLGSLGYGSRVNLERAVAVGGRLGGHIVSGHIDGTGLIKNIKNEGNAVLVKISAKKEITELIVEKGSIAIDGISLTVTDVGSDFFGISLIPHTGEQTTLLSKKIGDIVNLENDILAKYVKKLISPTKEQSNITLEFLQQNGF